MKKSRIAKMTLMGASIAALAATLTTSTYAWYVSNKEANIVGGTGTTGTAGADDSILVSWVGTANNFFKEIDFADASSATKNALAPIHYTAATTTAVDAVYYTAAEIAAAKAAVQAAIDAVEATPADTYAARVAAAETTAKAANPAWNKATTNTKTAAFPVSAAGFYGVGDAGGRGAASTSYIKFDVYVYAAGGATVTPTITINTNYDSSSPATSQIAYTGVGLPSGKSAGQSFSIDPLKAIWVQEYVNDDVAHATYFAPDATATSGADAHAYYTSVTGDALWATTTETSTTLPDIELSADANGDYAEKQKVTFVIYLDGADVDCFNSCAGYDIDFTVKFAKTTA